MLNELFCAGDAGTTEEAGLVSTEPGIDAEGGRAAVSQLLQRSHVPYPYIGTATQSVRRIFNMESSGSVFNCFVAEKHLVLI